MHIIACMNIQRRCYLEASQEIYRINYGDREWNWLSCEIPDSGPTALTTVYHTAAEKYDTYIDTYRCVITISILITLFPKSPCSIASTQHSCCTPAGFACASISCQKHVSLIISQRLTHCCVVDALKLLQTSHAVLRKQVFKIF